MLADYFQTVKLLTAYVFRQDSLHSKL